jgi:hypothetical protein
VGEKVDKTEFSREDRTRYRQKIRRSLDVFATMLRESRFEFERPMTGMEIELNLIDDNADPAMLNAEVLSAIADPDFQTELGQFNVEINLPPRRLTGDDIADLEKALRASLNHAEGKARTVGAHMVTIGILPTLRREHLTSGTSCSTSRSSRPAARTWTSASTVSTGWRSPPTRSRPRPPAPAPSSTCRSARRSSRRTGTPPR